MIVDNFAGGGGASEGIRLALGRGPDIAVNHDEEAVALHAANHPETKHLCGDVWDVSPRKVCRGRPVELAWFSPDCKHFSKAKGGKPVTEGVRGLAWVVIRWAREVRPSVIVLENVEEFQTWGPLIDGRPDPEKRGLTFRRWLGQLRAAGYVVEWRELRACDYGAPTTRKRLFIIARSDGRQIVWPEPTHGQGRTPYRTAAECIDWEIPCPSIFGRKKPLAEPTMRRIVRALKRHVIEAREPFILESQAYAMIHRGNGERPGQAPRIYDLRLPLGTVVAGGVKHALVAATLVKHYGGHEGSGADLRAPLSTITTQDHHALVLAEFGKVDFRGESYRITDIGMRMLSPRELYRAQGFSEGYRIEPIVNGRRLSKTAQIRMCGNSVSPLVAAAIVRANGSSVERVAA